MNRLILCLLAPLASIPALATTDDPDAFAVPDALGVREVPVAGSRAATEPPELPLALPESPEVDDPPPSPAATAETREAPRTTSGTARRAAPRNPPLDLGPPAPTPGAGEGATTSGGPDGGADLPLALPVPDSTPARARPSDTLSAEPAPAPRAHTSPLALPEPEHDAPDRFGAPRAVNGAPPTLAAPRAAPQPRAPTMAPHRQAPAPHATSPAPPSPIRAPSPPPDTRPMAVPGGAPPPIAPRGAVDARGASYPPPQNRGPVDARPAAIPGGAPPPPRSHAAPAPQPRADAAPIDPPHRSAGAFVGAWADLTTVGGEPATAHGIEVGFHLGRALTLGVAGGRAVGGATGRGAAFIGVRPGLTFTPDRPLSLQADMLFGVGAKADPFGTGPMLPINVVEPRVGVSARLGSWGRAEAHVGYRAVPPGQPDAAALSAPTLGVGLRLGWF